MVEAPHLLMDLGGTHARTACLDPMGRLVGLHQYQARNFANLQALLSHDLQQRAMTQAKLTICVAAPVLGDRVEMTNLDWSFSQRQLMDVLPLTALTVINDFHAIALAIPALSTEDLCSIGPKLPLLRDRPIALCGPGTGLGVAGLLPTDAGWQFVCSEGGHVDFSPQDDLEWSLQKNLLRQYGHVSWERLLSGPGLVTLYQAECEIRELSGEALSPAEISHRAESATCPACQAALQRFFHLLGRFAGNLALTLGSHGGVFLAGGILPRLQQNLQHSAFRQAFEDKGRYRHYNQGIATRLITHPQPGLLGLAQLCQPLTRQPR